jgi:hypothetical protein
MKNIRFFKCTICGVHYYSDGTKLSKKEIEEVGQFCSGYACPSCIEKRDKPAAEEQRLISECFNPLHFHKMR